MKHLVDTLLDLSQIQSGTFELSWQSVDVASLIAGCIDSVPLTEHHIVDVDIPPGLAPIMCDPARLATAITNLMANAVKFSPDGGTIAVRVRRKARRLVISVTDSGIGIASRDLARIFDRFTQADMSSTRRFPGTGMGLFITRQVVEAHGGRTSVKSTPGAGSTFTIEVPARPVSVVPDDAAENRGA